MKKEVWKAIPGYEYYYEVSNFGRVRSLERRIPHPRLGQQLVHEKILSQKVTKTPNLKTGEPSVDLQVALTRENVMRYYNVRRLVFIAFRRKNLNYSEDKQCVINIDGNGYNNRLENLDVVSNRAKLARAYARGRVGESYLKSADRTKWKKPYGGKVSMKPILMVSLTSSKVCYFKSVKEASRKTKIGEKEIISVAKNRYSQWNSFVFMYA